MALYHQALVLLALGCLAAGRPGAVRSRRSGDPCVEVAESLGEIIGLASDHFQGMNPEVTDEHLSQMSIQLTGYDLLEEEEREMIFCTLMESTTTSEVKAALDQLDIPVNLFRSMYDYAVVTLEMGMPGPTQNFTQELHAAGMLSLDRIGADQLKAFVTLITGTDLPGSPLSHVEIDDPRRQCRDLASYISEMISPPTESSDSSPYYYYYGSRPDPIDTLEQWTGLDLSSRRNVRRAVCPVVRGAEDDGVRGFYDAINDMGVFSTAFGQAYPHMVYEVHNFQQHISDNIDEYEAADNSVSDDSEYNWGPPPEAQAAMLELYNIVNILEAEGMFSLENDLVQTDEYY